MKDTADRPDNMADLTEYDVLDGGATASAMGGASRSDCHQGFKRLDNTHRGPFEFGGPIEDTDGTTHEGDPYNRGGFLNRPMGGER
jgi:hypothetical protein